MNPRQRQAAKKTNEADATVALQVRAEHDGGATVISAGEVKVVAGACCPTCHRPMLVEPAPAPPVAKGPTLYRVTKGGTFVQNGAVCTVAAGHLVRAAAYGRDGIERMLKRGIVLEPLD